MRLYILSMMLFLLVSCGSQKRIVSVANTSSIDRVEEIIEIDIENADDYAVFTKEGVAMQCQTTYEGKLLFPVTVEAESTVDYILKKSPRIPLDTIATGKIYPQWFNDFGWENDKIGFRTCSDKMDERGNWPKLYGYDIFTKRYDRPVLDILYGHQFDKKYQAVLQKLRAKKSSAAGPLGSAMTYHVDHGLGMDYYIVGPTLGCGTAALVEDGEILYPDYFHKSEILDKGGLRLTFRLIQDPVEVNGEMIQEIRTLTLDKGTHFNHVSVEYKNLSKPTDCVVGIVIHDDGKSSSKVGDGYMAYTEPMHEYGWQTYTAVIFPGSSKANIKYFDEPIKAAQGHLLIDEVYTPGTKMEYYMGAGWNRWGFDSPQDWYEYVEEQTQVIKSPLTYTIK